MKTAIECYHCNMRAGWARYYEIDPCCDYVRIYGYNKPEPEPIQTVFGVFGGRGFGIDDEDYRGTGINPKIYRMIYSNK